MSAFEKAIEIAAQAHAGQLRKNGTPYILHPMRVMMKQRTKDAMIVAILHDVVEDTNVTIDDLRRAGFEECILAAILLLTHKDKENYDYDEYIDRIASNSLATSVKIADLEDNMNWTELPEVTERDIKRMEKYHRNYKKLQKCLKNYFLKI